MPIRGVILILCVGAVFAFFYRDQIYEWLSTLNNSEEDKENKEENED